MEIITKELFRRIRRIEITTTKLVEEMLRGAYLSAFKGNGMEFEEVREFQAGDPVRSVDWNVTARTGRPHVKLFREERELTVVLLVDISASCQFGSGEKSRQELITEVAAALAFSAIKNNDKVGLILFSDKVEKYIPPRKGSRHVLRVIRELLTARPQAKKTDLEEALQFFGSVQKRAALGFVLSDFLDVDGASHAVKVAAKRHDLVAMCMIDPLELTVPDVGLAEFYDLETKEMRLVDTSDKDWRDRYKEKGEERLIAVRKMMHRAKAGFIALHSDKSYAASLLKYFQERERRR